MATCLVRGPEIGFSETISGPPTLDKVEVVVSITELFSIRSVEQFEEFKKQASKHVPYQFVLETGRLS